MNLNNKSHTILFKLTNQVNVYYFENMKNILLTVILNSFLIIPCKASINTIEFFPINSDTLSQEDIIDSCLMHASKFRLYSRERADELDKGLLIDSTIAYLWQQKAMPLFKQGKFEIGMEYIDKAVKYNRVEYLEYRAFIKCIFSKTYKDAIIDFNDCKKTYGNGIVMDHSYNFYIALSYLQLNEFKKAEELFKIDIESLRESKGDDWVHHLDLFYYGVSIYEQKRYKEAIEIFDLALIKYPEFSDVQYYKAHCLLTLGETKKAKKLFDLGKANKEKGYSINEDNVAYVEYPYQVR